MDRQDPRKGNHGPKSLSEPGSAARRVSPERRTPTLADVARVAGVSVSTASKALNGRSDVSAGTRRRVISAAEELSFSPNSVARNLLTGRTGTVGLITHDLEGRFSIPMLMGVEDAFGLNKVSVLLCDARGDSIRERYQMGVLLERRVDGLIIVGARPDPRPSLGHDLPVPIVYAYAPSVDETDISVTSDNFGAGRMAVDHLIACGRHRIGVISGDPTYGAAGDRVRGAEATLREAGLTMAGDHAVFGSWSEEWGRGAATALLGRHPDTDAILCGSDQIGRGVVEAVREFGKRVPEDVAVMGHDNWEILATGCRPPLTSIDMNLEHLGRRAARRLSEAVQGRPTLGVEMAGCRLVVRASTVG